MFTLICQYLKEYNSEILQHANRKRKQGGHGLGNVSLICRI